ncbi:cation-binding protein [Caballeronia temeraria]|uniref:Cation-binding protein n=1 Tax=Caballeronia temeraria TaxID=1777137 RepID=A0A158AXY0_9BURK|nr:hemerythrin domain-containing protein [Caballeronia temeraria]SAK61877.1 cation-binding protein [Caballeronia temeraria]
MSAAQTPRPTDALDMLEADHRAIEQLFEAFERTDRNDFERKNRLVQRACALLTIHAIVEEEMLYPVAQKALAANRRIDVDEAYVEHFLMTSMIERLANLSAGEDGFDASFTSLRENAAHHIVEEETTLFPAVRATQIDLVAMGATMSARKAVLAARFEEPAIAL